jgi:hypothetical protein
VLSLTIMSALAYFCEQETKQRQGMPMPMQLVLLAQQKRQKGLWLLQHVIFAPGRSMPHVATAAAGAAAMTIPVGLHAVNTRCTGHGTSLVHATSFPGAQLYSTCALFKAGSSLQRCNMGLGPQYKSRSCCAVTFR